MVLAPRGDRRKVPRELSQLVRLQGLEGGSGGGVRREGGVYGLEKTTRRGKWSEDLSLSSGKQQEGVKTALKAWLPKKRSIRFSEGQRLLLYRVAPKAVGSRARKKSTRRGLLKL